MRNHGNLKRGFRCPVRRHVGIPRILHRALAGAVGADDGADFSRTLKVRRKFVAERYESLIDALYSDKHRFSMEVQVVFEDGRTGTISADLDLRDVPEVKPVAPMALAS